MGRVAAREALAQLRAGVDGLLCADLDGLSAVALAGLMTSVEAERRRLEALDQRLLADVSARGLAGEYARTSPADLLVSMLRLSPGEAKARVGRAGDMGPRRSMAGESLPPIFPLVAAAQQAGTISAAHATVITRCIDQLPAETAYEVAPVAEQFLVEVAEHESPPALARSAALLLARVSPDGVQPREDVGAHRREFTLVRRPDGSSVARGLLTAEATAAWLAVFDSLAAPVPASDDGETDDRTAGQRRHDALLESALRLMRSGTLPDSGGVPVTILVRTTADDLRDPAGVAQTAYGDTVSVGQFRFAGCDAVVMPVVFDEIGGILGYGRTRRLASRGQRLALVARDGGCCFPGCDRPAAWTEVHHVKRWTDGGGTDLDNLCLLCAFHHREFERRGWKVEIADGVPQWIPPTWLDSKRRPRRNRAHHLTEFDFSAAPTHSTSAGGVVRGSTGAVDDDLGE